MGQVGIEEQAVAGFQQVRFIFDDVGEPAFQAKYEFVAGVDDVRLPAAGFGLQGDQQRLTPLQRKPGAQVFQGAVEKVTRRRWLSFWKVIGFLELPLSKNAVMGTCRALASCSSVLTLGEVLPFSIRLRVLKFRPLFSARVRMDSLRSRRSCRRLRPTSMLSLAGSLPDCSGSAGGEPRLSCRLVSRNGLVDGVIGGLAILLWGENQIRVYVLLL